MAKWNGGLNFQMPPVKWACSRFDCSVWLVRNVADCLEQEEALTAVFVNKLPQMDVTEMSPPAFTLFETLFNYVNVRDRKLVAQRLAQVRVPFICCSSD